MLTISLFSFTAHVKRQGGTARKKEDRFKGGRRRKSHEKVGCRGQECRAGDREPAVAETLGRRMEKKDFRMCGCMCDALI